MTGRPLDWKRWGCYVKGRGRAMVAHVYPIRDLCRHNLRGVECWCEPVVKPLEGGRRMVVHNSMDGRELIEAHGVN